MSNRVCANAERLLLSLWVCALGACAPARTRTPVTAAAVPAPAPPGAFAATGRARFVSPDGGEVHGRLRVRVQPPERVWAEVRSEAVFGLVADRVVACLPGDGGLLVQQDRGDRLERLDFRSTWVSDLVPGGTVAALLDWATGHVSEPGPGSDPGVRILRRDAEGRPEQCEWWSGNERRLAVEYDRWRRVGAAWVPGRIRARGAGGFRTEVELQEIAARDSLRPEDFQIDGNLEGR